MLKLILGLALGEWITIIVLYMGYRWYEFRNSDTSSKPLLEITVPDLYGVPIVKYKGEMISNKKSVSLYWVTRTDKEGKHRFSVDYFVEDSYGLPIEKKISESR
jgi:hypothetical protein